MKDVENWLTPPVRLSLEQQKIHLWRASLDLPQNQLQQLAKTLSLDEQNRADRFRFKSDRCRFIAGRGILRSLLGRYLQTEPKALQFSYGERGKPALSTSDRLQFNLAHSQGLALYAVAYDRSVGVDLEHIRVLSDLEALTRRFFSPSEHAAICALPPKHQSEAFFRYWTCKEAYLKATGEGLANLQGLEISLSLKDSARLIRVPDGITNHWNLQEFTPAKEFVGAVVSQFSTESVTTDKQNFRVDRWQFLLD